MVRGNDNQSSSLLPMKRPPQGSLKIIVENKPSSRQTPPKNYRCFHVTLKGLVQEIVFMFGTCIY